MIGDKINSNKNNKSKLIALAGSTTAITLLVVSIGAIGTAPFSVQQQEGQGPEGQERTPGPTITSGNIVDDTIVSADLKDGEAVRSEDIVDGQVTTEDLADGAVTQDKIDGGAMQPQITRVDNNVRINPNNGGEVTVDCPPGTILTGGGVTGSIYLQIVHSYPMDNDTWRVLAVNEGPIASSLGALALCMGPNPEPSP